MSRVIDSLWFNGPTGCVGIVIVSNEFEVRAYTGFVAESITEFIDAQYLAKHGTPFPLVGALAMSAEARKRHDEIQREAKLEPPY